MKEITAHDRFLERQRIANERAIEMGYGKAVEDALVGGTGITKDGKRIDPADFYAAPVADRAFLERVLAAMEGVIDVADRATDEFDALRSCVVDLTVMLHTPPAAQPAPVQSAERGEPVMWPAGLIDRIKAAEQRIQDGHAPRRIPADPTDVDLVLAEVRYLLEGKQPPFWINTTPPAAQPAPVQEPVAPKPWVGLTDEEIMDMYNEPRSDAEMIAFGRELEAKLKEKNQ